MAAYCLRHKITTLKVFTSALNRSQPERWGCDLPRHRLYRDTRTGLENYYGDQNVASPKRAITMDDLRAFRSVLDLRYFEHARDWCACLLAFFGLLRIGEYMDSGLRFSHVQSTRHGLDITIPFSKTSRVPAVVSVAARSDELCPARAFVLVRRVLSGSRSPVLTRTPHCSSLASATGLVIQPMSEPSSSVASALSSRLPFLVATRHDMQVTRFVAAELLQFSLAGVPSGRHSASRPMELGHIPSIHRLRLQPSRSPHRHSCPTLVA